MFAFFQYWQCSFFVEIDLVFTAYTFSLKTKVLFVSLEKARLYQGSQSLCLAYLLQRTGFAVNFWCCHWSDKIHAGSIGENWIVFWEEDRNASHFHRVGQVEQSSIHVTTIRRESVNCKKWTEICLMTVRIFRAF